MRFKSLYKNAFIHFDYAADPTRLQHPDPTRHTPLQGLYDTCVVDPPFLSEECWRKTAEVVRFLSPAAGAR
jgi:hypothetical protein